MNILIIIIIIVLIILVWCIGTINKLNRTVIKIDEALSGIDVALAKRYDVLTKMVEVVKGYVKHEKEIMFKVIELRKGMPINEKNKANQTMNENYNKIKAIVEDYPELKANENFKTLEKTIVDVEEHLQAARRVYNSNVSYYNQLLVSIPTCFIAKLKGMKEKDFFQANEVEKENVNVNL